MCWYMFAVHNMGHKGKFHINCVNLNSNIYVFDCVKKEEK